jgi:hypothetical protein
MSLKAGWKLPRAGASRPSGPGVDVVLAGVVDAGDPGGGGPDLAGHVHGLAEHAQVEGCLAAVRADLEHVVFLGPDSPVADVVSPVGAADTGSATSTYVRATIAEVAAALAALTGEPHPLAEPEGGQHDGAS